MKRREFITLLGGTAAWPLAARAQSSGRIRRIGIFINLTSDDAEGQSRNAAFLQGLGDGYPRRSSLQMNVDELDEQGARIVAWCFGPEGDLPIGDIMLAQKIALENDERAALAVANRGSSH
jgi:hypothetical protein